MDAPEPCVRRAAIESLSGFDVEAIPYLVKALDDPEKLAWLDAVRHLSRYKRNAKLAVPKLLEIVLNGKDDELREEAKQALNEIYPEWIFWWVSTVP